MGNIWTITRHTLAESIRQKTAMFLVVVLAILVLGLPFATRGDDTLSGAVQSFLSYSLAVLGFLLSCASIFMAKTVSDDLTGKQILMLMTKPLARWQYVLGKWLGIVLLNAAILAIAGAVIYAMTMYIAGELRGLVVLSTTFGLLTLMAHYALLRLLSPHYFTLGRWVLICGVLVVTQQIAALCGVFLVLGAVVEPLWAWIAAAIAAPFVALFIGYGALQIIVPRQMPLKRWALIFALCFGVSVLGDGVLLGLVAYQKELKPRDDYDRERLESQVLQARHATKFVLPVDEIRKAANARFDEDVTQGKYSNLEGVNPEVAKQKLYEDIERRWRSVGPTEARLFEFSDVRCSRSPEELVHISYRLRVFNYPPDEVLRCVWIVGDRSKGATEYELARRDVIDRRHTLPVPSDAVAPDGTLRAVFVNANPWVEFGEQQAANIVLFEGDDAVEVLFSVSSFGSNLIRALALVLCRLMFIAAIAVMLTTVLSFPVACLTALTAFVIAAMPNFLAQALDWLPEEGLVHWFGLIVRYILWVIYNVFLPKFTAYDGAPTLVEGRNVTLMWVLLGIGRLVFIQTFAVLLVACLMFRRREVSEVSV